MNKIDADRLIVEYQQKIFGFAMSKMRNIADAEELASNIMLEIVNMTRFNWPDTKMQMVRLHIRHIPEI